MNPPASIRPAAGKLGVLIPGLGAVATTTIAGVLLSLKGKALPIGALTQMGHLAAPLARMQDLEFGGWDIFPDDAYEAAAHAQVLDREHLDAVKGELQAIRPMPGAFYPGHVQRLHGTHTKRAGSKAEMVEQLRDDVRAFKRDRGCDRVVSIWCGSTEALRAPAAVHASAKGFEAGLARDAPEISNAQLYAWALLKERVPLANASPNMCTDFPAARELALELHVPVAGKDLKTGQTLVKTILAPGLKARMLGLRGWYSTNILGNRDGEVLDDPASFKAKEESKLSVLENILGPEEHPELYGNIVHRVRIDYYPPRGDAKEGWDSIDLFGWLGYPMQMKINFLCRDSILAAPLVLDLVLLLDLAERAGLQGAQEWLSFYFKSPMTAPGVRAEHDLFAQLASLKDSLRSMTGCEPLSRPGARPHG
jgi:myo-inositol-1-phosphate synthase